MNLFMDALSLFSAYDTITQEHIAMYDYAGLLALLIFIGGVFFWFMVGFCATVAAGRGLVKLARSMRRVMPAQELDRRVG